MKLKQKTAEYVGRYFLPDLTEKEEDALRHQELHKLRKSAHVQKMESMVNASHGVPPTEVDKVILAFDGEEAMGGNQAFALLVEDEDGELEIYAVAFLGTMPHPGAIWNLVGKTKDQLLQERFSRVPPRTVLP
jgi:hypothetical protein